MFKMNDFLDMLSKNEERFFGHDNFDSRVSSSLFPILSHRTASRRDPKHMLKCIYETEKNSLSTLSFEDISRGIEFCDKRYNNYVDDYIRMVGGGVS